MWKKNKINQLLHPAYSHSLALSCTISEMISPSFYEIRHSRCDRQCRPSSDDQENGKVSYAYLLTVRVSCPTTVSAASRSRRQVITTLNLSSTCHFSVLQQMRPAAQKFSTNKIQKLSPNKNLTENWRVKIKSRYSSCTHCRLMLMSHSRQF